MIKLLSLRPKVQKKAIQNMITIQTNYGDISIELDHEKTPKTAANFIEYVKSGFFENTLFHRVIPNFMIQGGGFEPGMVKKDTFDPIENEADMGASNKRGTIAMARTSDPHSATSQFFINIVDNPFLDFKAKNANGWGYCVFGQVVSGMDVVDKIKNIKTSSQHGHQDVPEKEVIIQKVILDENV